MCKACLVANAFPFLTISLANQTNICGIPKYDFVGSLFVIDLLKTACINIIMKLQVIIPKQQCKSILAVIICYKHLK